MIQIEVEVETKVSAKPTADATIKGKDYDENGGANAYASAGDHADSRYKAPDFFN